MIFSDEIIMDWSTELRLGLVKAFRDIGMLRRRVFWLYVAWDYKLRSIVQAIQKR